MEKKYTKKALLAASVAGLMAVVGTVAAAPAVFAENVNCYGVNACKGTGECGGKGHSCAGKNACKGQGFVTLDREQCLKMPGGSLTPKAS